MCRPGCVVGDNLSLNTEDEGCPLDADIVRTDFYPRDLMCRRGSPLMSFLKSRELTSAIIMITSSLGLH